jgi:uncharacterized protein
MSRPGSICIAVLHTGDVEAAAMFYGTLIGWSAIQVAGGDVRHRLLQWRGETVAAIHHSASLNEWIPHVWVDNIETTVASAVRLGAASVSTDAVAGVATPGLLRDREGARFGLWQPAPLEGATLMDVEGSMWWAEVLSDTPPVATHFYSSLFGWSTRETTFEPFASYTVFERPGSQEGGVLPIGRDWGVTPCWNSIFAVADCDQTLRRACELGGSTGFAHTVPKHGRIGSLVDPAGTTMWVRGPLRRGQVTGDRL